MTSQPGPRFIVKESELKIFKDISLIAADGFELELINTFTFSQYHIPGYEFDIKIDGQQVGTCSLIMELDFDKIAEFGNFGITITNRKFFGEKLPSRVAQACYPLFKSHGLNKLLITHDKDNRAIEKACQELNGQYLDTLDIEIPKIAKKRYIVTLA